MYASYFAYSSIKIGLIRVKFFYSTFSTFYLFSRVLLATKKKKKKKREKIS